MKIGDKVWIKDENHRVYVDDEGVRHSAPIYRKKFVERFIIGETRVSWIIGMYIDSDVKRGQKIKKDIASKVIYTNEEELENHFWIIENRYKISEQVNYCDDYHLLKEIDNLLKKKTS